MSKIKDEQLEKLQGLVTVTNQVQTQLGQLEIQKHTLLHQSVEIEEELGKFRKELEEEYGKVSVNIQDGTYTEIPDEDASDKKD